MSFNLATASSFTLAGRVIQEQENDPSETEHFLTFGDIDPNYRLSNAQCRVIELALDGARWSQIARALSLSRKTLWPVVS
jgi:DNA-binding NarL/FixJ family response regulator